MNLYYQSQNLACCRITPVPRVLALPVEATAGNREYRSERKTNSIGSAAKGAVRKAFRPNLLRTCVREPAR